MKMKHGLLFNFLLAAALLPISISAQDTAKKSTNLTEKVEAPTTFTPIGSAVVKNENVNVRGKASLTGEVITKLKKGENVTLLEEITLKKPKKDEPTNWFRISLPANTPVWVHTDFIDDASKAVLPKKLNVRAGPGENFSVIARMNKGEAVKQIRKVNDWIEIEPPTNAFAFVAAEFLEKQVISPSAPPPTVVTNEPVAEVVALPPAETPTPATTDTTPAETKPAEATTPEPTAPIVATPEPEKAPEVLPKRIVKREGIVRKARNIQSPTYFELEGLDAGRLIDYLRSPEEKREDPKTKKMKSFPKINLNEYVGRRVLVTGEESLDKRWKSTPVLEVETIELQQ